MAPLGRMKTLMHFITEGKIIFFVGRLKGPNIARGGVNSLFKNSTNSLEQVVSK